MVTYCTINRDNPEKRGAYFRVQSVAHARIMATLHPNLATALMKETNLMSGFGNWHLVGVTPDTPARDVFKATLIVNGKKR